MAEYSTTVAPDKEVAVISDSEGEDDGIVEIFYGSPYITLPPEVVWANIINYLPYDSLISCASTSRAMLYDALPLVTTLHIEKASQLRTGVVSEHLRDVRRITIYNLFHTNGIGKAAKIDEDTVTKSVPFLSKRFPQLESVAFWGRDGNRLRTLNSIMKGYGDHNYFLDSFCGAFNSGYLSRNLQIFGLRCPRRRRIYNCMVCTRVCSAFPLKHIGDIDLCLPFAISNEIIESREGGEDYLHSETRFMQLLGRCHEKVSPGDCCIIRYGSRVIDELNSFIESSNIDVTTLNPEDVVAAIKRRYPNNVTIYLHEDSFDFLKTTNGLPISDELLDPSAIRVENLDRMVKHIMEETDSLQKSMRQMNSLLRKHADHPIQRVAEAGVLPKIVELLQRNDCNFQLAASDILLNVAAWKSENVESIIELGAIPPLVHLLGSSHSEVTESAAWALGNIAGDRLDHRDLVLKAGVMQPLLKLIDDHQTSEKMLLDDHQTSDVKLLRTYIWTLHNLCRGEPKPDFNVVNLSLPVLKRFLCHSDDEVVVDVCWALSYLSEGPNENIKTVIDVLSDCIPRLVELLEHSNKKIRFPALKIVGNIVGGGNALKQIIIDHNALPCLLTLLSRSKHRKVTKEVCWIISNIAAGTEDQIQAVIDEGFVPKLVPLLNHEDPDIQRAVSWVANR